MIYVEGKKILSTEDLKKIAIESCIQEIQLWLGENPMHVEAGIDYMGVFNGNVFLKSKLESLLEKYKKSFTSLYVENFIEKEESISLTIVFVFDEGQAVKKDVRV